MELLSYSVGGLQVSDLVKKGIYTAELQNSYVLYSKLIFNLKFDCSCL